MATQDIIAKLQRLLAKHPLAEESDVVYLLVEIRKALERQAEELKYPFLKFYADWAVHSQKDRVTASMRQVIADVEAAATYEVREQHQDVAVQEPIRDFAFMHKLRSEVRAWLAAYGVNDGLTTDDTAWRFFVEMLAGVLEDQPIVEPTKGIRAVTFVRSRAGFLTTRIEFVAPVRGETHFDYEEAY
jgi:hypothetical protein